MPRQKELKSDKTKTWLEEYFAKPGYGPPGGTVAGLTTQVGPCRPRFRVRKGRFRPSHGFKSCEEMIDHVEMLDEHLTDDDPKKRIKAAEALSAYIADDAYLPEKMEVHPAKVRELNPSMASFVAPQPFKNHGISSLHCLEPYIAPLSLSKVLATLFFKPVPDRVACISAARCLAIMGTRAAPYASTALTKVLGHAGSDLRWEALVALAHLGPEAAPEAAPAVAHRAMHDEDARLRRQALRTLTVFGPDAAAVAGPAIAKACQDEDTDVQVAAMKCMKAMGPDMAPWSAKGCGRGVEGRGK